MGDEENAIGYYEQALIVYSDFSSAREQLKKYANKG